MGAAMYRRTTRELALSALPPALAAAIEAHASRSQLRLERTRCWLTHSENPPAEGFFGKLLGRRANDVDPDVAHDSALVLHPTHVLVATSGERRGTTVLSLPLVQATMTRGSAIAARVGMAAAADGVTLAGFPGEVGRPGTYFFGLGPEPAAEECVRALESAILAAKNPR